MTAEESIAGKSPISAKIKGKLSTISTEKPKAKNSKFFDKQERPHMSAMCGSQGELRPSKEGHKADALALGADEGRDKLR